MLKTKKIAGLSLAVALALGSTMVSAESSQPAYQDRLTVGVQAGTLGLGIQVGYALTDRWSVKGVYNHYDYDYTSVENDIDYRFDLGLRNAGLLASYKPFDNGFRVTGGIYHNGNEVDGRARYSGSDTLTIGNTVYSGTDIDRLDADISFNKIAPYLGVGYTKQISRVELNADLGVLYQGSAKVGLRATPNASLDAAQREQLRQEVERERRDLQNDLDDFKYYPVATVGVSYRF